MKTVSFKIPDELDRKIKRRLARSGERFSDLVRRALEQEAKAGEPDFSTMAALERLRQGDVIACLDVFDPEPVPADSPLKAMPNVFLLPHTAGVTAANYPRFLSLMIDELERHLSGQETRYVLTPEVLAQRRR